MGHDRIITSRAILRALMEVSRDRGRHAMQQLEEQEPELAEFTFEQLGQLNQRLWAAGLSERSTRRIYRECEKLVLTVIVALRRAHREMWEQSPSQDTNEAPPGSDA